jgi:hypothetical protein
MSARVFGKGRQHFRTYDGMADFLNAIIETATGQFRDQGIAFAVLVVGIVLQNLFW